MDDLISRQAAIDALHDEIVRRRINEDSIDDGALDEFDTEAILRRLPPAQPETHEERTETHACDLISRKAAIDEIKALYEWHDTVTEDRTIDHLKRLPSAQPDSKELSPTHKALDTISRKAAIESVSRMMHDCFGSGDEEMDAIAVTLDELPSAQPERTCVNCGRTVNNGGWYADGGTRCPIEEHYALPKDGFCHLWEKRNITDDDYPERRTDE